MSEDEKKEKLENIFLHEGTEANTPKRTVANFAKATIPSYQKLSYRECYDRIKAINAQMESIKNLKVLKAITNAQKKFENTRKILTSMLPNTPTPPLADRFKIYDSAVSIYMQENHMLCTEITALKKDNDNLKEQLTKTNIYDRNILSGSKKYQNGAESNKQTKTR